MLRRMLPFALMAAGALLVAGCSDGGDDDTGTDTTVAVETTRPGEVASLPEPTAVKGGPQSADEAAQELYDAWKAGDVGRGNAVSEPDAVNVLFRQTAEGIEWTLEGCEETATERIWRCTWNGEGAPTMTVAFTRGYGWRVLALD